MNSSQAADLAIFIICSVLFLAYNILLFNVSSFSLLGKRYVVLYAVNRQSRASWVQTLSKGEACIWQVAHSGNPARQVGCLNAFRRTTRKDRCSSDAGW